MKKWFRNILVVAFVLSIFLHLGTGLYLSLKDLPPSKDNNIEVTIIDKNKPRDQAKQMVEQSDKAVNDEIDEKAKYLSQHNQKVVQETKAVNNGRFQNQAHDGLAPKADRQASKPAEKEQGKTKKTAKSSPTDENSSVSLPKMADLKPQ